MPLILAVWTARVPSSPSPTFALFPKLIQHLSTPSAPVQLTQCADVTVQAPSQGPLTTFLNILTSKSTHSDAHPVGCFWMECSPYICLCLCFPNPCQVHIQCLINAGSSWISETLIFFLQSFIMWPKLTPACSPEFMSNCLDYLCCHRA